MDSGKKTIFLVDDDVTNLAIGSAALNQSYKTFTMNSGARLLKMLQSHTPDLILLDIEMPVMNGFEALEKLKAGNWADIPVIFLTGTTDYSIEEKSKKLGAAGIITKPFSEILLHEIINSHI